jgi:hypothetical protein
LVLQVRCRADCQTHVGSGLGQRRTYGTLRLPLIFADFIGRKRIFKKLLLRFGLLGLFLEEYLLILNYYTSIIALYYQFLQEEGAFRTRR